jgi:two-component system cell cycle sensor histidine kinase/response regulator CckA
VRDITERKRAEEEKARLESQLIQAQKMESVGRLAGGVAHDFNNMLGVIVGYAELIKSQLVADDPLFKDVLEIEKAANHSRDVTRQLLAFSRKQLIEPRPLDLNDLIKNTQKTLSRLIGEDIELCFNPGEDLWKINFDPSQVDQILINLAVNARDAMLNGGQLTIETANVQLDEAYCREHLADTPGDYVMLSVKDSGVGMDKETLSHAFEPFFTTKEVGKGTGLGLSTIYGIIKQNGGSIHVYSEPARGTAFKIYIPRKMQEDEIAATTEDSLVISGSETILLVEDEDMVRDMTTAMLEKIGYSVRVAETPQEALLFCENNDIPIDLLITDVVMPEMNGTELRDRIKAIRPGIKVLFMSGYTSNVIGHHGVLDKGVHFVQKPFGLKGLARKVRDAIIGQGSGGSP